LLGCPKAELVAYAKAENIADRPDASNAWVDIQRNRIRQELLPLLLRQYQPALRKTLPRVMDILGAEADYCGEQARAWLARKRRPAFARLPLALQRRALQRQLRALGVEPDFDLVAELCQWPDRPVTVSPETQVVRDQSGKVCQRETAPPQFCPQEMKLELSAPAGSANFGPVQIAWEFLPASGVARGSRRPRSGRGQPDGATAHVAASEEYFDAGKVGRHVVLRHWRPGDRFQPIGMKSGVRLQDLFVNQKVPRARRHELVVATTGQGGVFWVEGLRMAEPFKLDKQTALRLKWAWRRR
jgi:tRNA(Ile)-lysidine synthase